MAFDIKGIKELERSFQRLGKIPQTTVTKSARAGARIVLKAAKQNAPVDTGELKRGIVFKRERRTKQGKSVYDVTIDRNMNNVFVKESKEGKRSYYPASQEYGFLTVDGGYTPGYQYMKKALTENAVQVEKKILETASKDVQKALQGG